MFCFFTYWTCTSLCNFNTGDIGLAGVFDDGSSADSSVRMAGQDFEQFRQVPWGTDKALNHEMRKGKEKKNQIRLLSKLC